MTKIKWVYNEKEPDDGAWILVDREWPKDIPKDKIDKWFKELGPSPKLLSDWKEREITWVEYERRYLKEIRHQKRLIKELIEYRKAKGKKVALVSSEKDKEFCHSVLLKALLINAFIKEEIVRCNKMIKSNPKCVETYVLLSTFLLDLGKYKEAIENFDKAIELKPDFTDAWCLKGTTLLVLGKYKEAIENFDKAIELKPDFFGAWYVKGTILLKLEKYKKAIEALDKAVKLAPYFADAWYKKGYALECLGKYKEAIENFDKAIELEPDLTDAWCDRASVLKKLGKYPEALRNLDRAISLEPHLTSASSAWRAWYLRGLIYLMKSEYEAAKENISVVMQFASEQKDTDLENLSSGLYYWASGMDKLSLYLLKESISERVEVLKRVENDFKKGADYFGKSKIEKEAAKDLQILGIIVASDREFIQCLGKNLDLFKKGVNEVTNTLTKLNLKESHPLVSNIAKSKLLYFSTVKKALDFKKVDTNSLEKVEKILTRQKFKGHEKVIDTFRRFVEFLDTYRKDGYTDIKQIPEREQEILMMLIRPSAEYANGISTQKDISAITPKQIDDRFSKYEEEAREHYKRQDYFQEQIMGILGSLQKHEKDKVQKGEKLEYEEEIDSKNENYLYNLLELEISYINDELRVILRLKGKDKKRKKAIAEEEIEEFIKSERSFAFLLRLAIAIMVNENEKEGWLNKYIALYIKEEKPPRDRELIEFRKFLGNCKVSFLEDIAESKGLDKKEFKKTLVRTQQAGASVRLAIPNVIIKRRTVENLKKFECKVIPNKKYIRLPKTKVNKIRKMLMESDIPEESQQGSERLERIPVRKVVKALIVNACNVYEKWVSKKDNKR